MSHELVCQSHELACLVNWHDSHELLQLMSPWWPGMNSKLEETVSNCLVCVRFSNEQRREPLIGSPLPGRP